MALDAGDSTVQPGTMAHAMYDELNGTFGVVQGDSDSFRRELCAALARAVVSHIKVHGDVVITTSDGALQRFEDTDTSPPASNRTLAGAID